jgi:hypothetical protein
MRVFVVKAFRRFQRRENIADAVLCTAVESARKGLVDAVLGGEIVKQRVARKGQGKSGGFRVLIALRDRRRAVFLYGFAKSERANISSRQLADLKLYANRWLELDEERIARAVADAELREVPCDEASETA